MIPTHKKLNIMEFNMETTKALAGEFLVTYLFIFGALWGGAQTGAIQALSIFLSATAYIYAFGGISGAHFNPAVTFGGLVGQKVDPVKAVMYMVLQTIAGICAAATVMAFNPKLVAGFVTAKPDIGRTIGMEILSTFILVFVIYATAMGVSSEKSIDGDSQAAEQKKNFAGIAIGATLGFLCFYGGGFNPAVSTGQAVVAMKFDTVWMYWVGDLIGAAAAAALHTYFFAA